MGQEGALITDRSVSKAWAERKLMERIYARCHADILLAATAFGAAPAGNAPTELAGSAVPGPSIGVPQNGLAVKSPSPAGNAPTGLAGSEVPGPSTGVPQNGQAGKPQSPVGARGGATQLAGPARNATGRGPAPYFPIPPEFLGALTANESAGNPRAARFEPAVYQHLKAVAAGKSPAYGNLTAKTLDAQIEKMLHPKTADYHARHLAPVFAAEHCAEIAALEDETLRELATSWGYTQIMGYHVIGRGANPSDLAEPRFNLHLATALLGEFCARFRLDPGRDFRQMFHCWNTGSPAGRTFDPDYAEKGLRRQEIYRQVQDGLKLVDR